MKPFENPYTTTFSKLSDDALLQKFNREVGSRAWTNQRSLYLDALRKEIIARDWNFDAIATENVLHLSQKAKLNSERKIVFV